MGNSAKRDFFYYVREKCYLFVHFRIKVGREKKIEILIECMVKCNVSQNILRRPQESIEIKLKIGLMINV